MSDERLNLPSASSFHADVECPGRRNLLASIPPVVEVADETADRGTRIHAAFQTGNTLELNEEETIDYKLGLKFAANMVEKWGAQFNGAPVVELTREERLWLNNQFTLQPEFSGQLDRWYRCLDNLLILDLKTGWNTYVPPSQKSWQLRAYAVLAFSEHPEIKSVRVGYVMPNEKWEPTDTTDYNLEDLVNSTAAVLYHLWMTKQPEAHRHAGVHCRFCLGKAYCPEAGAYALLPTVIVNPLEMVKTLSPDDLLAIWRKRTIIEKIMKQITERLKALPADEHKRLGIGLGKVKNLDFLLDTKGAFEHMRDKDGVPEAKLWAALSFGKEDLKKSLGECMNWSGDMAAGYIKDNLAPFTEKKEGAASLTEA